MRRLPVTAALALAEARRERSRCTKYRPRHHHPPAPAPPKPQRERRLPPTPRCSAGGWSFSNPSATRGVEMTTRRKRARPGDVLEVRTSRGLAYVHYTSRHPEYGDAIRVLPSLFD